MCCRVFVKPLLAEEYEQLDVENINSNTKIVYDCMEDSSPYYDRNNGEYYYDDHNLIDLPLDEVLQQELKSKAYQ